MNTIKIILSSILMTFAMTSCSLFGGYNAERAEELADMMKDGENLTNDEYAEAIENCEAGFERFFDRLDDALSAGGNPEKKDALKELEDDDELCEMIETCATIYWYLSNASETENEFNSQNKKAFKNLEKLYKKIDKRWEKAKDIYPDFDLD